LLHFAHYDAAFVRSTWCSFAVPDSVCPAECRDMKGRVAVSTRSKVSYLSPVARRACDSGDPLPGRWYRHEVPNGCVLVPRVSCVTPDVRGEHPGCGVAAEADGISSRPQSPAGVTDRSFGFRQPLGTGSSTMPALGDGR
jgi:hypothetical protein